MNRTINVIKRSAAPALTLALLTAFAGGRAFGQNSPQIPIAPAAIPQFVNPLPDIDLIVDDGTPITLEMREYDAQVLPAGMGTTKVWAYLKPGQATRESYIGPLVIATKGQPTTMKFVNLLGNSTTTGVLAYKYSVDQTLHWADPLNNGMNMANHMAMPPAFGSEGASNYKGSIPAAVHLHGGEIPPQLDGGPDSWFTSDGLKKGSGYYTHPLFPVAGNEIVYRYPNTQEESLIWFHDHTLGATRLNVYAGLAGAYLLVDPAVHPTNLPPIIPLVVQDRMFDTAGQLYFPAGAGAALNPEHPYWSPEFLGDVIVVNGKAWPFKSVGAQRYTLAFINGSNARTYKMSLVDPVSSNPGPALWVVGTDGGLLDAPVKIDPALDQQLPIMPGERYIVIVDFAGYQAGVIGPNGVAYSGNWQLMNTAKAPYPFGGAVKGQGINRLVEFRVTGAAVADASLNPAVTPALRAPMVRLANPATGTLAAGVVAQKKRQLTLNEVMGMPQIAIDPVTGTQTAFVGGPLEVLVNNTKFDGKQINGVMGGMYTTADRPDFVKDSAGVNLISENPTEGETEVWEIVNITADAHPIHLHLVQFQLLNRQAFDAAKYIAAYDATFPGGGYDPMTGQPYPKGVYIPGFGPPLNYNTGNPNALGGNPDVNAVAVKNNKPLYLQGPILPPMAHEAGWKDTITVLPGQVTRIAVRWAPTTVAATAAPAAATFDFDPNAGAGFVWHCHIVDHEDNEMMRPNDVVSNAAAVRTYIKGTDY